MDRRESYAMRGLKAFAFVALLAIEAAVPALAQSPGYMSCDQLWYARNEIYAREGYCFETPQAIAVFGRGCFPPYGQLSRSEKERVNQLQTWERIKGC